jgi:hypothetical protein
MRVNLLRARAGGVETASCVRPAREQHYANSLRMYVHRDECVVSVSVVLCKLKKDAAAFLDKGFTLLL